jgi:hypothetical protein
MDARDIFKEFFGGKDPFENFGKFGFDDDDDDFLNMHNVHNINIRNMHSGFGKSPFENDDFFNGMGSSNFMSSGMGNHGTHIQSHGGNGMRMGGGTSTSIRKSTQIM